MREYFQHERGIMETGGGDVGNRSSNRGKKAPGVNPQGFGQDDAVTPDPKSKLENKAKKENTKI